MKNNNILATTVASESEKTSSFISEEELKEIVVNEVNSHLEERGYDITILGSTLFEAYKEDNCANDLFCVLEAVQQSILNDYNVLVDFECAPIEIYEDGDEEGKVIGMSFDLQFSFDGDAYVDEESGEIRYAA